MFAKVFKLLNSNVGGQIIRTQHGGVLFDTKGKTNMDEFCLKDRDLKVACSQ